jgi:hypothetical protein
VKNPAITGVGADDLDADLLAVVQAWKTLTPAVKVSILAAVRGGDMISNHHER